MIIHDWSENINYQVCSFLYLELIVVENKVVLLQMNLYFETPIGGCIQVSSIVHFVFFCFDHTLQKKIMKCIKERSRKEKKKHN